MLEALLGGIQGLGSGFADAIKQNQAAKASAEAQRKKYSMDLLKGVILQSLKPKGRKFSFGDDLAEYVDPKILEMLKQKSSGGGKKRRVTTSPLFPNPTPNPTPNPNPNPNPETGPKRITLKR